MMLLYGSGMGDGNAHAPTNLPILVLGGGAGQLEGRPPPAVPGRTRRWRICT